MTFQLSPDVTRDLLRNKCNRTSPRTVWIPSTAPAARDRITQPNGPTPPAMLKPEAGNHDIDHGSQRSTSEQHRHGICLQRRAKIAPQKRQQTRSHAASKASRPGVTHEMREGREAVPANDAGDSICHQTGFEEISVDLAIHRFSGRRSSSSPRRPTGEWAPKGTEDQGTAP